MTDDLLPDAQDAFTRADDQREYFHPSQTCARPPFQHQKGRHEHRCARNTTWRTTVECRDRDAGEGSGAVIALVIATAGLMAGWSCSASV
jgi:hypothetical protein